MLCLQYQPTEYNFTNTHCHKEFHLRCQQGVLYPALLYTYFKYKSTTTLNENKARAELR